MTSLPDSQASLRMFIQMSGAPGSGKSTMARLLQQRIGGFVIDHDVLRSALLDHDDASFDETAKRAYNMQWVIAEEALKQGLNVIIDSPCNFQEILDQGSALTKKYGAVHWYIECKVSDIDVLDKRLRDRKPMKSQRTGVYLPPLAACSARAGEDSHALFTKWIESPCRPERNVIIVDSTVSPEMELDLVLETIASQVLS